MILVTGRRPHRLNLHRKLEAVLGPDDADTLMAHLPPVTWHDVATKEDLRTLEAVVTANVHTEISRAMERQIRRMVTFDTALAALVFAAARLLF